MYEFLIGLILGIFIGIEDAGESVPYQTITYTDSGRVVKVYSTSAFKYRYMPNAYAIGWNTNDYKYWDTRPIKPLYVKTIHVNPKPKSKPKERKE